MKMTTAFLIGASIPTLNWILAILCRKFKLVPEVKEEGENGKDLLEVSDSVKR